MFLTIWLCSTSIKQTTTFHYTCVYSLDSPGQTTRNTEFWVHNINVCGHSECLSDRRFEKIEKIQKNQKCLFLIGKLKKHVLDMFGAKNAFFTTGGTLISIFFEKIEISQNSLKHVFLSPRP